MEVINGMKRHNTFLEQVTNLLSKFKTTSNQKMEGIRELIITDLRTALAPVFPLHQFHLIGSSITGLDLRGCDLDIYVANVRQGDTPQVNTLGTIRELICRSKNFYNPWLKSVPTARIIRCTHAETQILCSLNIQNKLSVHNSKLIKYYLTLDEKLRPLMIIIKLWTEGCGLKSNIFFSGYALYLMVIFYLQQEPYKLPSIVDLQEDCPANIEDEWNCAFSTPANEYPALHDESLLNLTAGFFRFYANFDYVTQVISPYLGITVKKVAFMKPFDLPDSYHLYKGQNKLLQINSGICIQDPFEHNRNVSASIPLETVGRFAISCKAAKRFITESGLLQSLLTKCRKPFSGVSFVVKKIDDKKTDQEWFDFVKTFTIRVLKEVLDCQVTEVFNSVITTTKIVCMSRNNIWENRIDVMKTIETQLPPEISDLRREIAVVQNILKCSPGELFTNFFVTLQLKSDPTRIKYRLKRSGRCPSFLHVAHYLRINFPTWLKSVEVGEKQTLSVQKEEIPPREESYEKPRPVETAQSGENNEISKTDDKISDVCTDSSPCKQIETSTDSLQLRPTEAQDDKEQSADANEETKHIEEHEIADQEEDDVPSDFFDDFSNQDFMDGLDIVNAWDEASGKPLEEDNEEKKKHSAKESHRKSSEKRKRYTSKSIWPRRRKRPRIRSRSRDKVHSDSKKTKRDKDGIKYAKDKETEKITNVDTGVVPLRMEMEDSAIMKEKRLSAEVGVERVPSDCEKRHSRGSGDKESPCNKAPRYSRSPVYGSRNRVASGYRRRRTSADSDTSDHELWTRRSRSRSRDSPLRRKLKKSDDNAKQKTLLEEIRCKLNEVCPVPLVQYNHLSSLSNHPNLSYTQPVPPPHSIPVPPPHSIPVPPPHSIPVPPPPSISASVAPPNPTMRHQQYDQHFFIGDANPIVQTRVFNNLLGHATGNMVPISQVQKNLMPQVPIVPKLPVVQQNTSSSPNVTEQNETSVKPAERNNKQTTDYIDKLFAEKKISLSDFLTITARREAQHASADHLQKKIKVILSCQDAIKALSEDCKFTGRLSVKPSSEVKSKSDVKYQSPLHRNAIVRFQFTTPSKSSAKVDTFAVALDKMLRKIGVLKEPIELEEVADVSSKNVGNSSVAEEDTTALTSKASLLNLKTKFEVGGCHECKKRKLKQFADVGSQCADGKEIVSVGTQVTEEESSLMKGVFPNELVAYLTPPKLLGKYKVKDKEVEVFEVFEVSTTHQSSSPKRKRKANKKN